MVKEEGIIDASLFEQCLDCAGVLVWKYEELEYNFRGIIRQALTSSLWKEHGYPSADLWLLREDGIYLFMVMSIMWLVETYKERMLPNPNDQ